MLYRCSRVNFCQNPSCFGKKNTKSGSPKQRLQQNIVSAEVLPPEEAAAAGLNTGEVRLDFVSCFRKAALRLLKWQETWEEEDKVASAAAEEEPRFIDFYWLTCMELGDFWYFLMFVNSFHVSETMLMRYM